MAGWRSGTVVAHQTTGSGSKPGRTKKFFNLFSPGGGGGHRVPSAAAGGGGSRPAVGSAVGWWG